MMHGDMGVWPWGSGHWLIGALFWVVVVVAIVAVITHLSRK